jgi:glutamate/aspartate transport system permease protein
LTFTLTLTALSMVGGVVLGTALALMRLSSIKPLSAFAGAYVNFMRSLPLVLVIFWEAINLRHCLQKLSFYLAF